MKKILLSALVGLASYTGVYASNEIVSNTVNTVEYEFSNLITNLNSTTESVNDFDPKYNCFTRFTFTDKEGLPSEHYSKTTTSSAEACSQKGQEQKQLFELAGYVVSDYSNNYSG
ncbi:hypothetical protein MG290_14515 (plasmid) [Flavobacterium sp. CBA20B-1]|uniref:hypothetical protein n=1 Tax=unclassified Flavobacterium TaxID=196869 RepID=UPI002224E695|nr:MULTISPECIES: hypothetical protein [unclassified Flavobacterium]WCM43599.1 hypothetical protein MG290_14515 [Flavobacterium sp. CBA20B-1]